VIRARQCARQIASALGIETLAQVQAGSVVLELCRQALSRGGGRVEFFLDAAPPAFVIRVSTLGAELRALRQPLNGSPVGDLPALGFCVELGRSLPAEYRLTTALLGQIRDALEPGTPGSGLEQLQQQDLELVRALEARRSLESELQSCQAEERAAREEALATRMAREHVLAVVAHDLRNPLFALTNGAFLLERVNIVGKDGDRVRKSAMMMRRAVDRMDHLISDLLDIEQLEAGNLTLEQQAEDVGALVREALEACAPQTAERKLQLDVNVAADLRVRCDRQRILQVFSKLLANAIKFSAEGGSISLGAQPLGHYVQFLVRDTGRGITDEELPHVFDRFWQAKKRSRNGIGLSLSLAKGLVEAHGGSIGVESRLGVGTVFRFTLLLAERLSAEGLSAEGLSVEGSLAEGPPVDVASAESPLEPHGAA